MKSISVTAMAAAVFVALAPSASLADEPRFVQVADMHVVGDDGTTLPGAGILRRNPRGVEASLHMTGLAPDSAYTVWWVIFNDPDECTVPCGPDDVGAGVGQVFHATGYVTGADGVANVSASLARGSIAEGVSRRSDVAEAADPKTENGLRAPFRAEIHLVAARNHGPLINGRVAEQIGTIGGGCDVFACTDEQAVAFLPVTVGGAKN